MADGRQLIPHGCRTMPDTVFRRVHLREINDWRRSRELYRKYIPEIGIEYLECRRSRAFQLHSILEPSSPPFACDFSPTAPDLILIAQEDGLVHLYNTAIDGVDAFVRHYEAHANAVFDVKWLAPGKTFLTASGDQSIRLIDAESGSIVQQFFGHSMSVRSISLMPSDTQIFASASRDGSIRLWDTRVKPDKVNFRGSLGTSSVGVLPQCHVPTWSGSLSPDSTSPRRSRTPKRSQSDAQSVTSVVFMDDNTLVSAGSTDGSIKIWDLRRVFCLGSKKRAKPKFILPYRGISRKRSGYSDLALNSYRTRLYANCLDNVVYEYDLTQPDTRPVFVYTGHVTDSFYVKLDISPDDSYIICGSSNRQAHIYAIGRRKQCPVVLSGHTGEVSVPRWCKGDPTRVVTLSDESQAFVWNMFPARQYVLPEPGELAGLAERLSPSKALVSPKEQERRILSSPRRTNTYGMGKVINSSGEFLPHSPSLSAARRRQSNIRHFLEVISPPSSSNHSTQNSTNTSTNLPFNLSSNLVKRSVTLATLTETLGGVVQRFPALSVVCSSSHGTPSTPPGGCYAPNTTDRSPLFGSSKFDLSRTPDSFCSNQLDSENSENIDPDEFTDMPSSSSIAFDCVDGRLAVSPIVRCSTQPFPPSPIHTPTFLSTRTPLSLRQALFGDSPYSSPGDNVESSRKRGLDDCPSSSTFSSPKISISSSDVTYGGQKRRRLTVLPNMESTSSSVASPPTTPIRFRRRRMTSVCPRTLNPITRYFKRNE